MKTNDRIIHPFPTGSSCQSWEREGSVETLEQSDGAELHKLIDPSPAVKHREHGGLELKVWWLNSLPQKIYFFK